jgi:ethanolamine ammonia-lyase large subunit
MRVARAFDPLLVNSVVGFIGPEYLYDGKEIIRAGLEDHFCGKLLGLPLGVDVCYTNHAEADQDDMDNLLTLLAAAGVTFIMGVPGADDVMLNYQSTSFHDALYVRDLFGLKRAPEFDDWLFRAGLAGADFRLSGDAGAAARFCVAADRLTRAVFFPQTKRPDCRQGCHNVERISGPALGIVLKLPDLAQRKS